jgi:hypothetical protein
MRLIGCECDAVLSPLVAASLIEKVEEKTSQIGRKIEKSNKQFKQIVG